MKKLAITIVSLVGLAFASSCSHQIEEVFPENAAARVSAKEQECFNLLTSSERGWIVEYYPSSSRSYGGCAYGMIFNANGNVQVTSEIAEDPSVVVTSHFSTNTSSSVVLTFDTYNSYIHYWSDADMYSGNALEGEYEFAYETGDEERMVFRGLKTGNRIVFTAIGEDDPDMVTTIQGIKDYSNQFYNRYVAYYGDIPIGEYELTDATNGRLSNVFTYIPDGASEWQAEYYPFCYNADGMRFYEPLEIAGEYYQNFIINPDGNFVALDENGDVSSIILEAHDPEGFVAYDAIPGTYTLYYNTSETMTWTITPSGDGYTYTVTGSASGWSSFPFSLVWTPFGYLTMNSQYVGTYSSYIVYLCGWDAGSGYLNRGTAIGMHLVSNGDPVNTEFTFVNNGYDWGYDTNSFILYAYTSSGDGAGSLARMAYPTLLVRNNN